MVTYTKYSVDVLQMDRNTGRLEKIKEVELLGDIKLKGFGRAWDLDLKDERDLKKFDSFHLYKFYTNLYEETDYDEELIYREEITPETFKVNKKGTNGTYIQLDVVRGGVNYENSED